MLKKHYNINVSGWVQGVGFRYSAMSVARDHGISGFVRNEPDGSVYIEAEGKPEELDQFLQWCYKGPGFGRIDRVVFHEAPMRNFESFTIKHF
jgi:acylphosphatase